MMQFINKVSLGINTYWSAWRSIGRQLDYKKIIDIQTKRLKKLIEHCSQIKYYRELFHNAGVKPELIKTTEDLKYIPPLSRQDLQSRFWDFLPLQIPGCRIARTSGSTGTPVCIFSDDNGRIHNSAAVIRTRKALVIPLLAGAIITPLKSKDDIPKAPHWSHIQGIHKTYHINPYSDRENDINYARRILSRLNKPTIIGIASAVRAIAERIKDGYYPRFYPRAIMTSGECLTPNMRNLIEMIFEVKINDIYACSEGGDLAWQCRHNTGYHINSDNCIIEILRNDKPVPTGEMGEVAITNLNRYAMPLLRYKNGDMAILKNEPCPCGCKLPMLAEICGRTGDNITLPNGKVLLWNHLKSHMTHPQIRQFQLIQNHDSSFTIKYVPEKNINTAELDKLLLNRYRNFIGNSIDIKIEKTQSIPTEPSGKSKLVISNYKSNAFQD